MKIHPSLIAQLSLPLLPSCSTRRLWPCALRWSSIPVVPPQVRSIRHSRARALQAVRQTWRAAGEKAQYPMRRRNCSTASTNSSVGTNAPHDNFQIGHQSRIRRPSTSITGAKRAVSTLPSDVTRQGLIVNKSFSVLSLRLITIRRRTRATTPSFSAIIALERDD